MSADLHVHSTASDGQLTPREIVYQAEKAGLTTIALTDHDTVDGIQDAYLAAEETGLEVIPGIELNTNAAGQEIHVLGYYLDLKEKWVHSTLEGLRTAREDRAKLIVAKLARLGMYIDYERLIKIAGGATMGRPHIAQALFETGYAHSVEDAFEQYLDSGKPAYVAHHRLDPFMAIELVTRAGGIPVLAHPGLVKRDEMIADFVNKGLLGLEVFYPFHTPDDVSRYKSICLRYGLVMTGGTDYHGPGFKYPPLGTVTVPDQTVAYLKQLRAGRN